MSWQWQVLGASVRFLFLLAPFMSVAKDFNFVGDELAEVREFALAGSCRAMLVTFPPQFLLSILAQLSGTKCETVNWFVVALYVFGGFVVAGLLYIVPTRCFRGTIIPFIWLAVFTGLSVVGQILGLQRAVALVCTA